MQSPRGWSGGAYGITLAMHEDGGLVRPDRIGAARGLAQPVGLLRLDLKGLPNSARARMLDKPRCDHCDEEFAAEELTVLAPPAGDGELICARYIEIKLRGATRNYRAAVHRSEAAIQRRRVARPKVAIAGSRLSRY